MVYILLLMLGFLVILGELIFIFLWIGAQWISKNPIVSSYNPRVSIIVPCKGINKEFQKNILAISNQDYKYFKLIFVIDSYDDPAYNELIKLFRKNSKAKIEFADSIEGCSGKIAALIKGVRSSGDVDVYVFADSDIRPHRDWLRYLVSPLDKEKIGGTTGFRWYFPYDFKSSLLSTWNLASILFLFYNSLNYAWGGSTAIRKQLFMELDIETKWRHGFSDDLILTKVVKNAGYKIKLIPKCIVESFDEADIHTFLKWGSTQFTWVKWYYPSIWIISFIGLVGIKILTFFGVVLILTGFTLPGLLMISSIFFEMIFGWFGIFILKNNMWYTKKRHGSVIVYLIMMPIAFYLMSYNFLTSLFKKKIVWKEREYLKSKSF